MWKSRAPTGLSLTLKGDAGDDDYDIDNDSGYWRRAGTEFSCSNVHKKAGRQRRVDFDGHGKGVCCSPTRRRAVGMPQRLD
jgi:hypothetical protein